MEVDKFLHTERGIRRTSYPLVPCGDGGIDINKYSWDCAFEGKDEPIKKRKKHSTAWSELKRCLYERNYKKRKIAK